MQYVILQCSAVLFAKKRKEKSIALSVLHVTQKYPRDKEVFFYVIICYSCLYRDETFVYVLYHGDRQTCQ